MLRQAGCGGRHSLRRLRQSSYNRRLPPQSLCAAPLSSNLSRISGHVRLAASSARPSSGSLQPSPLVSPPSTRPFATATSDQYDIQSVYIPFEGQEVYGCLPSPWEMPFPLTGGASRHDVSSLIIIKDFPASRPRNVRKMGGIGGEMNEMLSNLDVSLSVGMFDRAGLLLRRLLLKYPRNSPEVRDLHNKYLHMLISHMILNSRPDLASEAQRWFEVEMRRNGNFSGDSTTYALMLKMASSMLHGSRRRRTVDRYWGMVRSAGLEEAVLTAPVLSDADRGLLAELCLSRFSNMEEDFDKDSDNTSETATNGTLANDIHVKSTEQKGLGLVSLKETLSLVERSDAVGSAEHLPEELQAEYLRARQLKVEQGSVTSAIERWRKETEIHREAGMPSHHEQRIGSLFYEWHTELSLKLKHELELAERTKNFDHPTGEEAERIHCAPYLSAIGPDKLAALSIALALNIANTPRKLDQGIPLTQLVVKLGKGVEEEYVSQRLRQSILERGSTEAGHERALRKYMDKALGTPEGRRRWRVLLRKFKANEEPVKWPTATHAKVGALLASLMFKTLMTPVERPDPSRPGKKVVHKEPAFRHVHQLENGNLIGFVHLHANLVRKLGSEPSGVILAKYLPMVAPPRPWTGAREGGFLNTPMAVMRIKDQDKAQLSYVRAAADRGDLKQVFEGLSILGKTGWKINKPVFDVMLQAWNSGEAIADLAPLDPKLPEPVKPDTDDQAKVNQYYHKKKQIRNTISGYHSQRCFQNFQMEVARALLDDTFYFPHNMDFRGRAYPLPPYLNQMGADNCRGLLLFSKGKELGKSGLRWLKIHLANVFGFDKASFDERAQFSIDHLKDVYDSAERPLDGERWWLKAEDPFQCLAACIELRNALNSPEPTKFVSHLPVHQDGSCNGLQHYAALGGDVVGAQQVNLEPSDRPSDIYTAVSEHVKDSIARDAEEGDAVAAVLKGKVTRKVVKQTVMTNVYGVTFLGATRQVRKQLADLYPELLDAGLLAPSTTYITRKIFAALTSMFTGAHGIQFWLGDCANRITQSVSPEQVEEILAELSKERSAGAVAKIKTQSKERSRKAKNSKEEDPKGKFSSTVIWTTPLNLPVVQPYRAHSTRQIDTVLQKFNISEPFASDPVSRRKQLQAFPPNFIHSLDATHMFLSATKCDELGLTFSAVHDSFWTHAGDVDTMNRVLRDAFIRMHSEEVVARLRAEFVARYGNNFYLARVKPGTLLAQKLKEHRRENSKSGKITELLTEYRRAKLLASENPAEQAQGREMVTPASIFAADPNGEESLQTTRSLGVAGMGEVTEREVEIASLEESADDGAAAGAVAPLSSPADLEDDSNALMLSDDIDTEVDFASEASALARASKVELSRKAAKANAKKSLAHKEQWLWLPMSFLPIPPKGEFDVMRLKNSNYFFS